MVNDILRSYATNRYTEIYLIKKPRKIKKAHHFIDALFYFNPV